MDVVVNDGDDFCGDKLCDSIVNMNLHGRLGRYGIRVSRRWAAT